MFNVVNPLPDGPNKLSAQATDRYGHVSALLQNQFRVRAPGTIVASSNTSRPGKGNTLFLSSPVLARINPPVTNMPVSGPSGSPAGAFRDLATAAAPKSAAKPPQKATLTPVYGRIPLSFELNRGQTDASVRFLTRGVGHAAFFTHSETVLVLHKPKPRPSQPRDHPLTGLERTASAHPLDTLASPSESGPTATPSEPESVVLHLTLVGAQPEPLMEGLEPLITKSHYLIGNDPKKWITDVPHYAKIQYHDIYPGINQIFYGKEGVLEYDLVVKPGADPTQIRLSFGGADLPNLNDQGDVILNSAAGPVTYRKPIVYQDIGGERRIIGGRYRVQGVREMSIEVNEYDRTQPLVIDPIILYSTYLGGSGGQYGEAIAVDGNGSAYVTGNVYSLNFPTVNPYQGSRGTVSPDAFIAKFSPGGNTLIYATYLGGNGRDDGTSIAVDAAGYAYITGQTLSTDFPTVAGAPQTLLKGTSDGFVTKLNQAGNGLVYSTYLGGSGNETPQSIAVDTQTNAYVAGQTGSFDFPTTPGAFQRTTTTSINGFVTKLDANGGLVYSTYLGSPGGGSHVYGVAVDTAGSAYVVGDTFDTDFPTVNPIYSCPGVFVTKFAPTGSSLSYSTCISAGAYGATTQARGVAVDAQGSAYVTGYTSSVTFPVVNAYQPTNRASALANSNAFVSKLNAAGNAFLYSTYLGGSTADAAQAITIDSTGSAYVTGESASLDFPVVNPLPGSSKGPYNMAFVTKFNPAGNTVAYSTYLGGLSGQQLGAGIAVDTAGNAYITGFTSAKDFPVVNPLKGSATGQGDQVFVTKISAVTNTATTTSLATSANNILAGQPLTLTATVSPAASTGNVTFFDGGTALGTANLVAGVASFSISTLSVGGHVLAATYTGDSTYGASASASISVTVFAAPTAMITAPLDGARYTTPATIAITANADSGSGYINRVEFFDGSTLLYAYYASTNSATFSYTLTLTNVATGLHSYTVNVRNTFSASTTSSAVNVTVVDPPSVNLTSPASSTLFIAPALITLQALPANFIGSIARVEYFKDGASLGAVTAAPYNFAWNTSAAGTFSLTAKVTDSNNISATSAPVTITVATSPGITVNNLTNGVTVANDSVTVTGNVQATANSSVSVNGVVGAIAPDGSCVVNNVPLVPGANILNVTVTAPGGQSSTQTLNVTSSGQAPLDFRASHTQGLAPLTVIFTLTNHGSVAFDHADVYCEGTGAANISIPAATFSGATARASCTYLTPGVYTAKVNLMDASLPAKILYTATQSIQVDSVSSFTGMLQGVYFGMLDQLKVGNINGALNFLTATVTAKYAAVFTRLGSGPALVASLDQLKNIQDGRIGDGYAEFLVVRNISGVPTGFFIYFIRGEDGIWRIDGM